MACGVTAGTHDGEDFSILESSGYVADDGFIFECYAEIVKSQAMLSG